MVAVAGEEFLEEDFLHLHKQFAPAVFKVAEALDIFECFEMDQMGDFFPSRSLPLNLGFASSLRSIAPHISARCGLGYHYQIWDLADTLM